MKVRIWYDGGTKLYYVEYKWLRLFWRRLKFESMRTRWHNVEELLGEGLTLSWPFPDWAQEYINELKKAKVESATFKKRRRELSKCVHEEVI